MTYIKAADCMCNKSSIYLTTSGLRQYTYCAVAVRHHLTKSVLGRIHSNLHLQYATGIVSAGSNCYIHDSQSHNSVHCQLHLY